MQIINNKLIGITDGSREDAISQDEYGHNYEYIISFSEDTYLKKTELTQENKLDNYKELLLILCNSNDEILNTIHISEYDINKMINNYEFTDGSFIVDKTISDNYYEVGLSVYNENTIYLICNDISKGYLFGKVIVEEEEE